MSRPETSVFLRPLGPRGSFMSPLSTVSFLLLFAGFDQVFRIPTKWRSHHPSHALVSKELQYFLTEISSATAQDVLEKHLIQSCINKVVSLTHQHPPTPTTLHISQSLPSPQPSNPWKTNRSECSSGRRWLRFNLTLGGSLFTHSFTN